MVGWVAVWQAAKKDLSHSPYVTCFPNASAVRICYQPAPADGLGVLNCSLLTISFSFSYLPLSSSPTLCPACVTCHMDVIADKRKLMHVESTAAPTHTHTNKSPTYSYVSSTVMLPHSHVPECIYSLQE